MKPDWKNAPEWANWLAMDDDGEWYWYEDEPLKGFGTWRKLTGREQYAGDSISWMETKEKRK